jgi:hypothetical protein
LSYNPTPSQALLLFGLLARHGACAQAELMPKVKKADREALVKEKLITSTPKRPLCLTLEDLGWSWAAENLGTASLPPAQRTLGDLCARLREHLATSGETLADFIGSKPDEIPPPESPALKRSRGAYAAQADRGNVSGDHRRSQEPTRASGALTRRTLRP